MTHITRPGEGPAFRVVTSHTATPEQRQAALDHIRRQLDGDTAPDDLEWCAPGEQVIEPHPVKHYMARPWPPRWIDFGAWAAILSAAFLAGAIVGGQLVIAAVEAAR